VDDVEVTHGTVKLDERRGIYNIVWIDIKSECERHVEVSVSPTGRSIQVYVDGKQVHCG
jgi:hypothetical protein